MKTQNIGVMKKGLIEGMITSMMKSVKLGAKCLVAVCMMMVATLPAMADVTIRFVDKGEVVLEKSVQENYNNSLPTPINTFFTETDKTSLEAANHLQSFDGFEFVGWKEVEPINHEREYGRMNPTDDATDAEHILSQLTITTEDRTLFAVYRRTVDCYRQIHMENLEPRTASESMKNYLIVANYNGTYKVMGNQNRNDGYIGANNTNVTVHTITRDNVWHFGSNNAATNTTIDKIYEHVSTPFDQYVWGLTYQGTNYYWRNRGNENYYLYFNITRESNGMWSWFTGNYNWYASQMINTNYSGFQISEANDYFRIGSTKKFDNYYNATTYYFSLYYSEPYFTINIGENSYSNTCNILLYKEAKEYHFLCHGDPYTVYFKACGSDNCAGFSVSPASATQTAFDDKDNNAWQSSYINEPWRLRWFQGITLPTPTISQCPDAWTFLGWLKSPLETTTTAPASYLTSPYNPIYNNETLYAVYGHNSATDGTYDYYTSYPTCDPYTVYFDEVGGSSIDFSGVTGTVNESAKTITQETYKDNITMPKAVFSNDVCKSEWDFQGWAETECAGTATLPTLMIAGSTYKPITEDEHFYAVYGHKHDGVYNFYTSYPTCTQYTVTLDPGTGTFVSTTGWTQNGTNYKKEEVSIVSGVNLLSVQHNCMVWNNFAGWSTTKLTEETAEQPTDLIAAGELFHPQSDVTLYAVYVRGGSLYHSTPDTECTGSVVTLHACSSDDCGDTYMEIVGEEKQYTKDLQEASAGAGVEFVAPIIGCARWTFVGWKKSSPYTNNFTTPTGLISTGETYYPATNETFYAVYKHANRDYWTSTPDCGDYDVTLYACEGTISGGTETEIIMTDNAGAGFTLPECTPSCGYRGWLFCGWIEGAELSSTQEEPTVYTTGSTYYPLPNSTMTLYAVYKINRYDLVTSTSQLTAGSKYAIVFHFNFGDDANMPYEYFEMSRDGYTANSSYLGLKLNGIESYVDEHGIRYIDKPADNYIWKIENSNNATYPYYFRTLNNNYLFKATGQNASQLSADSQSDKTPFAIDLNNHYLYKDAQQNKYIHFTRNTGVNPNVYYVYVDKTADECYLFKDAGTYYASWAHCMPYTVMFDGCDGNPDFSNLTSAQKTNYSVDELNLTMEEQSAGKGVVMPTAKDMCDGWMFAGWAEKHIDAPTATADLDQAIYPAGSVFVPNRNKIMLYAVYYQTENKFTKINNLSDIKPGVNHLLIESGRAMSNTCPNNYSYYITGTQITANTNEVTNTDAKLNWTFIYTATENIYSLYNGNVKKFLGLTTGNTAYANLEDIPNCQWLVEIYNKFSLTGNRTRGSYSYLGVNNNNFGALQNKHSITLYRQQATFRSYPCSKLVEATRWENGAAIVESLTLTGAPTASSLTVTSIEQTHSAETDGEADDGTYRVYHKATPGSRIRIKWGEGFYNIAVPYVATDNYKPNIENFPDHFFVVASGEYTINKTTNLNRICIYSGATLNISDGVTLNVDTLVFRTTGDQEAPVINIGSDAKINISSGIIYHDLRIPDDRYYMVSLPFASKPSELRYSGLIPRESNRELHYYDGNPDGNDYWLKYYDGKSRSEAVLAGNEMANTYWTHIPGSAATAEEKANFQMTPGQGYIIGIADNTVGNHRKRTLRFKMDTIAGWIDCETGLETKGVAVTSSNTDDPALKRHMGWNFIGNPYLHTYYPGAASGLLTGHYEMNSAGKYLLASDETSSVPYLTFYNAADDSYYQTRADASSIPAFSAAFIQVESGNYVEFDTENPLDVKSNMSRRMIEADNVSVPVNTGLLLYSTSTYEYDQTGLVIADQYTTSYEIGGDLMKMVNRGRVNLYSIMENTQLAFNALDNKSATQPIPLGVVLPKSGEYAFALDTWQYDPTLLRQLILIDYEAETAVDLLLRDYEFKAPAGTNNTRFALQAVLSRKATDLTTEVEKTYATDEPFCYATTDGLTVCNMREETDIRIFDLLGKQIYTATGVTGKQHFRLGTGVYNIVLTVGAEQTTLRGIVR